MNEPAADLGIVMAIASSYKNKPIAEDTIVFGEVGLSGEVRAVTMPEQRVAEAKKLGFKTCAMALTDNSVSIDDPVLHSEERLAIVLGTEGDGLHEQTIDSCDYTVKIPMSHGVDSLNVAAASAVAFWELAK